MGSISLWAWPFRELVGVLCEGNIKVSACPHAKALEGCERDSSVPEFLEELRRCVPEGQPSRAGDLRVCSLCPPKKISASVYREEL